MLGALVSSDCKGGENINVIFEFYSLSLGYLKRIIYDPMLEAGVSTEYSRLVVGLTT